MCSSDLHAAAADIWLEKAASVAARFDFSADGSIKHVSQIHAQYMSMVRYHRSRRSATTGTFHKWPKESNANDFPWIGNLAEPD